MDRPAFVISLDFELYWGVHDVMPVDAYKENLVGARQAIPEMLALFEQHGVRATWAIVGFLHFGTRADLLAHLPDVRPEYDVPRLSPYPLLADIAETEAEAPVHLGRSLVERIRSTPGQEIATHTFSHFYCTEPGPTLDAFSADLRAARAIAGRDSITLRSIVFPRNQVSGPHLDRCAAEGLVAYRGQERSWIGALPGGESRVKRALRLLDAYANISGQHTVALGALDANGLADVRGTRFLRPYMARLRPFEPLRRRRIMRELTAAARRRHAYHLWWHPHNFGRDREENMSALRQILTHFSTLRDRYGMESRTMAECAAAMGPRPA